MKTTDNPECFRNQRLRPVLSQIESMAKPLKLLDVGGTPEFWQGRLSKNVALTILNVYPQAPLQGETIEIGDGADLSRYEDKAFDVVFSNSALAFVGGIAQQRLMAAEIRRVGVNYYVQTPNKDFPVDWRTYVPFFHWLPNKVQAWILQRIPVGRWNRIPDAADALRAIDNIRDVNYQTLRLLFPGAEIRREKKFGLTKSFMVWSFPTGGGLTEPKIPPVDLPEQP